METNQDEKVILFDLGGTLVRYFDIKDFPMMLTRAILEVQNFLLKKGLLNVPAENIWHRVEKEDCEPKNYRERPLEKRIINIFQLSRSLSTDDVIIDICKHFMKPIFSLGYCYKDSIPTLQKLKMKGFRTAVISNTTWESPAYLWREEVKRLGLDRYLDGIFFYRDVGWRKPAKPIFEYALKKLQVDPSQCIFIGDDPRWDIKGLKSIGIEAVLINRRGLKLNIGGKTLGKLDDLFNIL